ncbi:PDZ and LIM domain protein Zasp isoform X13 [Uranotaenia lowii]|uniref:PDZ and LIM domain protein Zasp isoform X13 n=1 Tax=Uranotaenia lowii TaxID=190385 RepID=UPI002478CCE5|nr:PDZ and LIM domain protein Zasp isoform X13 [Uranotaenia lowii]
MANLITVRLQRNQGQPWGFRLQGGKDFSSPLVLQRVNGGSVADQVGLMAGDALVKVNSTEVFNLRHKEAQDVIMGAGNSFELTVSRGTAWRPSVTPTGSIPSPSPSLPGNITPVTKTSLAATPQPVQHIGSAHNQAAKPFAAQEVNGTGDQIKSIVNNQYNTPVAMYSDETIAETLSSQAEVLAGGVLGVNFKKNERVYSPANSEVYKLLHEQGNDPEPGRDAYQQQHQPQQQQQQQQQVQQHQQQQQQSTNAVTRHVTAPVDKPPSANTNGLPAGQNICSSCERLIVGVFVRIKDKNLHADCFKCATCGTSLKNQGYFNLNNKLYCDIHARLAAIQSPPPGTNGMVPVTFTKPGQKTGVQAISAALNAHANLNGRSQSPYTNAITITTTPLTVPPTNGPFINGSTIISGGNGGLTQSPSHSRSSSTTSSSSGYCPSSSLSPVTSNKVSPLHSRTSSENELILLSPTGSLASPPPPPPPLPFGGTSKVSSTAKKHPSIVTSAEFSFPPPPPLLATSVSMESSESQQPVIDPASFGPNGLAQADSTDAASCNGDSVTQNEYGFIYKTIGGAVIRSVLPPGNNSKYKNQNNTLPKPFGAPLPTSNLAQVQPPSSFPPVAGSVPTPFSAAITGQAPSAPAPSAAPAQTSFPPAAAPAPASAPAAAPAAVPTPQDDEEQEYYVEENEEDEEQVQIQAESPVPPFTWPPKRVEDQTIPTAVPIYIPPPETQKVTPKKVLQWVVPPPLPKDKSNSPPEEQNQEASQGETVEIVVQEPEQVIVKSVQSKSAPELSRRQSDAQQDQQEEDSYETYTTSTSASSEEYRMYSTQTSQPIVTYYDTPLVEMDYPFGGPLYSAQTFGHEIPSQMEGMPVPSGRISMTDALATAPERPYTPFLEAKFEGSEVYQDLLKQQPSIQVDPDKNFSAFASVSGNRTPMPFKPILPEPDLAPVPEQPQEVEVPIEQPEPEPEPISKPEKVEEPKDKTPPKHDLSVNHYSLALRRDRESPLNHPAEIPPYQRKWFNLPTQNPPRTPEPPELRQNVPLAFVDKHSQSQPIAKPVNIREQVTLKKTQPFTVIQPNNRTIPVIQMPIEEDAELAHFNNAHTRLQAKGVIDRGQSFTPSMILTKHPTTIPYYQHQLGFEEYFAESKQFDGRRTPQTATARKSPAFGPPPNPLKAFVPPSRDGIPNESGLYLSMGKLQGTPWYANKDHVPTDIQQKLVQQHHGMGPGWNATAQQHQQQRNTVSQQRSVSQQRAVSQQSSEKTVRSQERSSREISSERSVCSASQVGNALIQKRVSVVEDQDAAAAKFSSKIKEEEAPQKGFVAQQTRRFSGQDDALNIPPQMQQYTPPEEPLIQISESFPQKSQPASQTSFPTSFPQQMVSPQVPQKAADSFPTTSMFPEPLIDRFPAKSSRKVSVMIPQKHSPTPSSGGFKAQFNRYMYGSLPEEQPQQSDQVQSWPPQIPSVIASTNTAPAQAAAVKPPLPVAAQPQAPVAESSAPLTSSYSNHSQASSIGFSNTTSRKNSCRSNISDRSSGASAGSGAFNKGRAACSTSAPTRGRGVMNNAVAPGGRVPLCGCCNQQIRGPFITALGRIWCPDHFICHNANCKRPLADIGFVEEKGDLYCEYCFEQFLAPMCSKCNNRVKGDCLNAIGKQFHPECFKCTYCNKLFGNNPFFLEEGDPYCEADWNELFTTKCFACGFPVEAGDKWVEALNNNYHSQCFNCTSCKKNLEGQSFFAKGGRPFCKNHAR